MPNRHEPPNLGRASFTCPHCGAYAHQEQIRLMESSETQSRWIDHDRLRGTRCAACARDVLWWRFVDDDEVSAYDDEDDLYSAVWPPVSIAPESHPEMPDDVRTLFSEAGDVGARSPRAAAALLRLALEALLREVAPEAQRPNDAIGVLVGRGLEEELQQAMDVVRIHGNQAVHTPGEVQLDEKAESLPLMFELINLIVERMIAQPKRVKGLYSMLPDGAKKSIDLRNQRARDRAAADAAAVTE